MAFLHKSVAGTLAALVLLLLGASAGEEVFLGSIPLSRFGVEGLDGWEEKVFAGRTAYTVVKDSSGEGLLKAHTRGMASGLFKKTSVDLTQTPFLNWTWKVEGFYRDLDEHTRAGDDYPARVYIVFSGGLFFWRTRALNYVWSSAGVKGRDWPNAFTANARMVALRSREDGAGVWYPEKRNIREDFKRYFGEDIKEADAIAIMTDADQSGQEATAWYGDLFMSEK